MGYELTRVGKVEKAEEKTPNKNLISSAFRDGTKIQESQTKRTHLVPRVNPLFSNKYDLQTIFQRPTRRFVTFVAHCSGRWLRIRITVSTYNSATVVRHMIFGHQGLPLIFAVLTWFPSHCFHKPVITALMRATVCSHFAPSWRPRLAVS